MRCRSLTSVEDADWAALGLDLAFCALPHGTTQKVIKDLMARAPQTKVVDLSADFRLADPAAYARWYGHEHFAPELQNGAVYGLTEIYRDKIRAARLVANPGCYTSCAELALIPLLKAKAIDPDEIVIDAKSGMTGAGRAAKEDMLFSEVSEGIHAYGVGHHRHMAELDQEFSLGRRPRRGRHLHAASGADEPGHPLDDLCPWCQRLAAGSSCGTVKVLREGAVRPRAAVRQYAADPPCARLQHDLHRRRGRPHRRPRHYRRCARQSDQGRIRPGGAEHEPDAWLSGDDGPRAGGAVSVMADTEV